MFNEMQQDYKHPQISVVKHNRSVFLAHGTCPGGFADCRDTEWQKSFLIIFLIVAKYT